MCAHCMTLWISPQLHYLIKKKVFPSSILCPFVWFNNSPTLPSPQKPRKYLNRSPNINYDRTLSVFFQLFQWASFKLCCARHLWPLFYTSAHHTVTRMNFLWFSAGRGCLCTDGCFLFNGNKGVPMVTPYTSVLTLISGHTSIPFSLFKEAKPVALKLERESGSPVGLVKPRIAGPLLKPPEF